VLFWSGIVHPKRFVVQTIQGVAEWKLEGIIGSSFIGFSFERLFYAVLRSVRPKICRIDLESSGKFSPHE